MDKFAFWTLKVLSYVFIASTVASCGISSAKQEQMQMSLENSLNEAFLNQDNFVAFIPDISLKNIERGGCIQI